MSLINKAFGPTIGHEQFVKDVEQLKNQLLNITKNKIAMRADAVEAIQQGEPLPHINISDKPIEGELDLDNKINKLEKKYNLFLNDIAPTINGLYNNTLNTIYKSPPTYIAYQENDEELIDIFHDINLIIKYYINNLMKPLFKNNNIKKREDILKHLLRVENIINKILEVLVDIFGYVDTFGDENIINDYKNWAEAHDIEEDKIIESELRLDLNIYKNNIENFINKYTTKLNEVKELIGPLNNLINTGTTISSDGVDSMEQYLNNIFLKEIEIPDPAELEGEGKKKKKGKGILDYLKGKILGQKGSPKYHNNLKKFGDEVITKLQVVRRPIDKLTNFLMNIISLGQFSKGMKESGFDSMFHLAVIINDKYNLEKISNLTLDDKGKSIIKSNSEVMDVPLNNKNYTIQQALDNTLKVMGTHNFYNYNAYHQNCQDMIINFLKANGYGNQEVYNFVKQDMGNIIKETPELSQKIVNIITRIGGEVGKIMPGLVGEGKKQQNKIRKVLNEFKEGKLKTPQGKKVKNYNQALAIALSEANKV